MRVVDVGGSFNLYLEAPNQFLRTQSVRPKHFDGDNATGSVAGLKDRTHGPILTDLLQEFVSGKRLNGRVRRVFDSSGERTMEAKGVRAKYVRAVWALGIRNCHGEFEECWGEIVDGVKWTMNAKKTARQGSWVGQGWLEGLATTDGDVLFIATGIGDNGQVNVVNVGGTSDVPYPSDTQLGTFRN